MRVTLVATGVSHSQVTDDSGTFSFPFLPVGIYGITVEATGFAPYHRNPIPLSINERARVNAQMEVAAARESVQVEATAPLVDTSTNVLGKVVTGREILDLPLNGRNFTQLGLLQVGVVPLTQGVLTAGGSLRTGQAYAVNGQRPESNNYLLDGARIVDRVDGAFALKVPVDAIAEFLVVYIQEAHPSDLWQMDSNVRENVVFTNPQGYLERVNPAGTCAVKLGLQLPALVDSIENTTEMAYTGWPDRMYVADREGRVAFKSPAGPFGFKPQKVRETLQKLLPR